jgi:hypothetical protein
MGDLFAGQCGVFTAPRVRGTGAATRQWLHRIRTEPPPAEPAAAAAAAAAAAEQPCSAEQRPGAAPSASAPPTEAGAAAAGDRLLFARKLPGGQGFLVPMPRHRRRLAAALHAFAQAAVAGSGDDAGLAGQQAWGAFGGPDEATEDWATRQEGGVEGAAAVDSVYVSGWPPEALEAAAAELRVPLTPWELLHLLQCLSEVPESEEAGQEVVERAQVRRAPSCSWVAAWPLENPGVRLRPCLCRALPSRRAHRNRSLLCAALDWHLQWPSWTAASAPLGFVACVSLTMQAPLMVLWWR